MIEIVEPEIMRETSIREKKSGKRVGIVPTMGYLHHGHSALLREARKENDIVILTIFVNPTQFGPGDDFERYPRDIKRDRQIAAAEHVDYIFHPSVDTMYPENFSTYVSVENVTDPLEGEYRPGHFRGVTTVVMKLFQVTQPDNAYFGQKDAQQLMVITKMVRDLCIPVTIRRVETVREHDGLAMSSRNVYLSRKERKDAAILYTSLQTGKNLINNGETSTEIIVHTISTAIKTMDTIRIDYVEIVDPQTFKKVSRLESNREYCIALAARVGKTRLIDNIFVSL
jgi:pantoate--beta-alanine ligase